MPEMPAPMINTSKHSAGLVMSHTIGMYRQTGQELTRRVTETNTDVVIVGAGFAGLTAARELVQRGHDVLVLEGRDRVGGQSGGATLAGVPVDLGATFVGPTQDEVLGLAADLGCRNCADV